jgi:hypothetical protein
MPAPIRLIVRETEKNALELHLMRDYFLELIHAYISIRDSKLSNDLEFQSVTTLNQTYANRFQNTRFSDQKLSFLLATILGPTSIDQIKYLINDLFAISPSKTQVLESAITLQMVVYALAERFQDDPATTTA